MTMVALNPKYARAKKTKVLLEISMEKAFDVLVEQTFSLILIKHDWLLLVPKKNSV